MSRPTATADPPLDPPGTRAEFPWIAALPRDSVERAYAEGKLHHHGLAEDHRASLAQPCDDRRIACSVRDWQTIASRRRYVLPRCRCCPSRRASCRGECRAIAPRRSPIGPRAVGERIFCSHRSQCAVARLRRSSARAPRSGQWASGPASSSLAAHGALCTRPCYGLNSW